MVIGMRKLLAGAAPAGEVDARAACKQLRHAHDMTAAAAACA
jgi:hypothetical protein